MSLLIPSEPEIIAMVEQRWPWLKGVSFVLWNYTSFPFGDEDEGAGWLAQVDEFVSGMAWSWLLLSAADYAARVAP